MTDGFFARMRLKISKRESPFYDKIYRGIHAMRGFPMPYNRKLYSFLYNERVLRRALWHNFWRIVYYEPMFKSQCVSVGKNLHMEYAGNGSATIKGPLRVTLGDNVRIFDNTIFAGLKVLDNPELVVGDSTYIGPQVRLRVGKKITIGRHCLIVSKIITDNPGHPIDDVVSRLKPSGGLPTPESIRPITIGDFCFLPLETVVYPGVTIGDGVVARIGTHISHDVPPFCQVAGNPMRIVRKLPIPEEIKDIVGEDRYQQYLKVHAELALS